jgi:hypothetical protein
MPSRRSFLAFLGLAPVAAPAAIAALVTPGDVIVGADVTAAGVTIGHILTPAMIRAEAIRQCALLHEAALIPDPAELAHLARALRRHSAGTPSAGRIPAHGGRFLPSTGRSLRAPVPLGDDERAAA